MSKSSEWEITAEDHEPAEPGTQFIAECLECGNSITSSEIKASIKEMLQTTMCCGTQRYRIYQTKPPVLRDETS